MQKSYHLSIVSFGLAAPAGFLWDQLKHMRLANISNGTHFYEFPYIKSCPKLNKHFSRTLTAMVNSNHSDKNIIGINREVSF